MISGASYSRFCLLRLSPAAVAAAVIVAIIRLAGGVVVAFDNFPLPDNIVVIVLMLVNHVVLVDDIVLVFHDVLMLYNSLVSAAVVFLFVYRLRTRTPLLWFGIPLWWAIKAVKIKHTCSPYIEYIP